MFWTTRAAQEHFSSLLFCASRIGRLSPSLCHEIVYTILLTLTGLHCKCIVEVRLPLLVWTYLIMFFEFVFDVGASTLMNMERETDLISLHGLYNICKPGDPVKGLTSLQLQAGQGYFLIRAWIFWGVCWGVNIVGKGGVRSQAKGEKRDRFVGGEVQ